jgi:hypothetical protein
VKSNLVDIACVVRSNHPSKKAIAVVDGTEEEVDGRKRMKWFWLPRSEIEINPNGTVTMPEWLALEKGLI